MAKSYVDNKVAKKKSTQKAAWLLIVAIVIAIFIVIKFALSGEVEFNTTGLPSNNDAYDVSKEFIRSTVRSSDIEFQEQYQIAKKDDSTYVIRATATVIGDNGEKKMESFRLLMQYKGGKQDQVKNWDLLNISEH